MRRTRRDKNETRKTIRPSVSSTPGIHGTVSFEYYLKKRGERKIKRKKKKKKTNDRTRASVTRRVGLLREENGVRVGNLNPLCISG